MKRTFLIMLALLVTMGSYAQKEKKPKINQANTAWKNGDLGKAKDIIDQAISHEKTKDDPKTWYYRGLIYATIDTIADPQYNSLSDNALEVAMEAFNKAEEMGDADKLVTYMGDNPIPVLMSQQVDGYYSHYFNSAVEAFQNDEYQKAVDMFGGAAVVVKGDTNALKNAAYAAHNGELFDLAKTYYRKSIDAGSQAKDMYTNLLYIVSSVDKDNEAALAIAQEAKAKYPTDGSIAKTEINLLIQMDKVEEARDGLLSAIEDEPDNTSLIFSLAAMYEELGEQDKALETYNQALDVDPDHYESNFNKGVILLNRANEVAKEYTNLGISKADQKKARELEPVIKQKYSEALPQWEKLYEIRPRDRQVVETLSYIYQRLDNNKKSNEMEKVLESLPEE